MTSSNKFANHQYQCSNSSSQHVSSCNQHRDAECCLTCPGGCNPFPRNLAAGRLLTASWGLVKASTTPIAESQKLLQLTINDEEFRQKRVWKRCLHVWRHASGSSLFFRPNMQSQKQCMHNTSSYISRSTQGAESHGAHKAAMQTA